MQKRLGPQASPAQHAGPTGYLLFAEARPSAKEQLAPKAPRAQRCWIPPRCFLICEPKYNPTKVVRLAARADPP